MEVSALKDTIPTVSKLSKKFLKTIKEKYNTNIKLDALNSTVEILKRSSSSRTSKDIDKIVSFLNTMSEFIQILNTDHDQLSNDILRNLALNLSYAKLVRHEVLFRYGDRGSEFYIILSGTISILVPKMEKVMINDEDYIKYLIQLRMNGETELLTRCISINSSLFLINDNFDDWLRLQLSPLNRTKTHYNMSRKASQRMSYDIKNSNHSGDLINLITRTLEIIDRKLEHKSTQINLSAEGYIQMNKCVVRPNQTEYAKYLTVFTYAHVNTLHAGNKFGDFALEAKVNKRTATLLADDDCHLGVVDKDSYDKCLKTANEKARKNFMSFILSYHVFQSISKLNFEKNYFNLFAYRKFQRGDVILKENCPSDFVYFIKSGEYEITTRKSLIEVNTLCDMLNSECDGSCPRTKLKIDLLYSKDNEAYIQEKKFNDDKQNKLLFTKRTLKIGIIKGKEIVGCQEYYDQVTNLPCFTITTLSYNCDGYVLPKDMFKMLCAKELGVRYNFQSFVKLKRKFLLERLLSYKKCQMNDYLRSDKPIKVEPKFHLDMKVISKGSRGTLSSMLSPKIEGGLLSTRNVSNEFTKYSLLSPIRKNNFGVSHRIERGFISVGNKDQMMSHYHHEVKFKTIIPHPDNAVATISTNVPVKYETAEINECPARASVIIDHESNAIDTRNYFHRLTDDQANVMDRYNSMCNSISRTVKIEGRLNTRSMISFEK